MRSDDGRAPFELGHFVRVSRLSLLGNIVILDTVLVLELMRMTGARAAELETTAGWTA